MKRRAVIVFLVFFTAWPLVHRALVAAFEINPWKLAGWAMFCVPNPSTKLRVQGVRHGLEVQVDLTDRDRLELNDYNLRRGILGALEPRPTELAEAILARHPELDGVVLFLSRYSLDPRTALLEWEVEETRASRP